MKSKIMIIILLAVGGISVIGVYANTESITLPFQLNDGTPRLYVDNYGNVTSENNFAIAHSAKLYLDAGHAGTNNTYMWVPPGKTWIEFAVTNIPSLHLNSNFVSIPSTGNNFIITPTGKLILDGESGGNNYITNGGTSTNVAIFSNGVQTITANNGNVGIGTTSPSSRLSLGTNLAQQGLLVYESGNYRAGFGVESSQGLKMFSGDILQFGIISPSDATTYSEKMRITSIGNVGIGTSTPAQKLEVNGGIQADGNLTTSSTNKEFKITAPSGVPICIGNGC